MWADYGHGLWRVQSGGSGEVGILLQWLTLPKYIEDQLILRLHLQHKGGDIRISLELSFLNGLGSEEALSWRSTLTFACFDILRPDRMTCRLQSPRQRLSARGRQTEGAFDPSAQQGSGVWTYPFIPCHQILSWDPIPFLPSSLGILSADAITSSYHSGL